jgi:hypothetical protein
MKLFELPRNSKFKIIMNDPNSNIDPNIVYTLDHIDGMYSYCTYQDVVFHIAAMTEVEKVEE